ncbi:OLC1v1011932C1 [Oldenlandia corymbosa var. corymbosa]|nr:OLC1v1011932C1 [Oldenlandia corymbosa var. corymbosa]
MNRDHYQVSSAHVLNGRTSQSSQGGHPNFPGHFQLAQPHATHHPHSQLQISVTAIANSLGGSTPGIVSSASSGKKTSMLSHRAGPSRLSGAGATGGSGGSPFGHGQGGAASPLKTMELAPAVRRKKRKLPENEIPGKVATSLPESALYSHLCEVESHIDALLVRKKTEIAESLKNNPPCIQKMLRLYVFNTFENQADENMTERKTDPPSWSLKIFGRILEDGSNPARVSASWGWYPKFSSFFRKITIYLDQNLYPDNHVILWEKSRSDTLHEGFEIRRKGDKEFTAIIRLEMDFVPEKFRLSPALQEVLGLEVETRPRIMTALWHYVRTRKLQLPDDTSTFVCDPPLRKVFGEDRLKFAVASQKISQHLTSPKPIHLEHKLKLSGNSPAGNNCYDVLVDIPIQPEKELLGFISDVENDEEIEALDEAIFSVIKDIHEHTRKRAFFLGFSHSPAEFINALLASQARDLKVASGDTSQTTENEQRSEFYTQPW